MCVLAEINAMDSDGSEVIDGGVFAPIVVMYDDVMSSIDRYVEWFKKMKFTIIITDDYKIVKKAYSQFKNAAAYLFDMHIEGITKIGRRKTSETNVGASLVCEMTSNGKKHQISHCGTLSEFATDVEAQGIYDVLAENGQILTKLNKKRESLDEFIKFIDNYLADFRQNIKSVKILKNINGLQKAFSELCPDEKPETVGANIMGYVGYDAEVWADHKSDIVKSAGNDLRDRIDALVYIKHGLILHFGLKDLISQTKWIHEKREELGGKSSWELLTSGKINDIHSVAHLVNKVIG